MPQLRVFCSDFCLTDYPRIDPSRELEGRLGAAPHFSPTRASDRGAYLCRLHGLLLARDLASPVASARTRPDPTCRSGQVCRHPDARCALPDDRRPHSDFKPLHPTRTRSKNPARTTQAHDAGPTTTAHQLSPKALGTEIKHRCCSADLLTTMSIWSGFAGHDPSE